MRSRLTLTLLVLSLPLADAAAQRVAFPPSRRATPDRPAEKPPLMPGVHDSRAYSRYALSRFSVDQYPMLSYLQTNGLVAEGIPAGYVTFGDGTHIGFRAAPSLSVTADFTSSVFGGPFSMGSAEIGVRVKPWTELRVTPFVDARLAHAYTSDARMGAGAVPLVFAYQSMYGDVTTGNGGGSSIGIGAETRVSTRFWLTSTLSHARFGMTGRRAGTFEEWDYRTNMTRLTVGVRYNHGRWLDAP